MSRLGAVATSVDLDSDRYDWRDYGACIGIDPTEINFFPERGQSTGEAKAICRGCPVREVCLEVALVNGEKFGIWGGLSERERRRLRRQRRLEPTDGRTADRDDLGDRIVAELEHRGGTWWITVGGIAEHFGYSEPAARKVIATLHRHDVITVTMRKDYLTGANKETVAAIHLNEGPTP